MQCFLCHPLKEELRGLGQSIERWAQPWQSNESISPESSNTENEVQLRNKQVEINQSETVVT
jgi:hypothetical protein